MLICDHYRIGIQRAYRTDTWNGHTPIVTLERISGPLLLNEIGSAILRLPPNCQKITHQTCFHSPSFGVQSSQSIITASIFVVVGFLCFLHFTSKIGVVSLLHFVSKTHSTFFALYHLQFPHILITISFTLPRYLLPHADIHTMDSRQYLPHKLQDNPLDLDKYKLASPSLSLWHWWKWHPVCWMHFYINQ